MAISSRRSWRSVPILTCWSIPPLTSRPLLQNGDICGEWHESVSHLVEFLAGLEQEFSASRQPDNGVISRRGVDPPRQLSRKLLSTLDRLGCVSFRNAFASI